MADWHEIERSTKLNSGTVEASLLINSFTLAFGKTRTTLATVQHTGFEALWLCNKKYLYGGGGGGGGGMFYVLHTVQIYLHWVTEQTVAWMLTRMKTTWSDMLK